MDELHLLITTTITHSDIATIIPRDESVVQQRKPHGPHLPAAMALKAVHVSNVPKLDEVPQSPTVSLVPVAGNNDRLKAGSKAGRSFQVIGHRGKGMNVLASPDKRLRDVKENSVRSFNEAAAFPVDFVEFDVQVTKDGCPIVFHDDFILAEENGSICERRVTELHLEEFLSYGPQKDPAKLGKSLYRKTMDGRTFRWCVEKEDSLCTLQEVFHQVDPRIGVNIELKFDDHVVYKEEELAHCLRLILKVVFEHAKDRAIFFSSFQPDAALLMRKLQSVYPVYFLTNGGTTIYGDSRRNSLDAAINLCVANSLHGIVSEVRGVFRNPSLIPKIKESNLSILTYGQLNNVAEAVYMQHLMGIDGVIVDLVKEITEAMSEFVGPTVKDVVEDERQKPKAAERPQFSQRELTFLLKLIPELVQH